MKYNDSKEVMMEAYPELFQMESQVLDHLFFVNGNGYEWHDGELQHISFDAKGKLKYSSREEYLAESRLCIRLPEEFKLSKEQRFLDLIRQGEYFWVGADRAQPGFSIYPISQYSDILNIPDNIQPDWLEAASKAIAWAESPYCKMTKADQNKLGTAKLRVAFLLNQRKPA